MTPTDAARPLPPAEVVHDLVRRSCTPETGTNRHRNLVQGLGSRREQRAEVRRQRLVDAQLGPEPRAADQADPADAAGAAPADPADRAGAAPADPAPRQLAARARSLWCGFLSGLG